MNANLVAIIFTGTAAAFMLFILRSVDMDRIRIAMIWVAATAIAFLVRIDGAAFFLLGVMLVALAPMRAPTRVGIYLAVFMALPHHYSYSIPFPGLNYLIEMDFVKLATLTLLAPLFFSNALRAPPAKFKTVERLLLAFAVVTGVASIRELPITSVMRLTLDQLILIFIPYFIISRSLTTTDDIRGALHAFLAGAVVLAAIAAISSLRNWNYFAAIGDQPGVLIYSNLRAGFLRIHATAGPPILALAAAAGAVISLYLRSKSILRNFHLLILLPLFAFVIFVSGSRGGQLAGILAVSAYLIYPRLGPLLRRLTVPVSSILVVAAMMFVLSGDTVFEDAYGTFQYRAEVFRIGIEQVGREPLFGSTRFLERPEFQSLRQGEGIIDIVNSYLQVALYYGLVGLSLFVGAHFFALSYVLRTFGMMESQRIQTPISRKETKRICGVLIAMHVSYLFLIFTTSSFGWTMQYGYAILALQTAMAVAVARANLQELTSNDAQTGEQREVEPVEDAPRRKPYGARFVRRG